MKKYKWLMYGLLLWGVLFTVTMMSTPVSAAVYEGRCGNYVTWRLETSTGLLTISGEEDMFDYDGSVDVPWDDYTHLIQKVQFTGSVTSIGDHAFFGCRNLTSITIPDSVNQMGRYAFGYCTALETVNIGSGLFTMEEDAFYSCSNLQNFVVSESNLCFKAVDGVLYNKKGTVFVCYPQGREDESYTVENGVTKIGDYAFSQSKTEHVRLPDGVERIGNNAFADSRVSSLKLPRSLKEIGERAYAGCNYLKSVVLGDNVISVGEGAFSNCTSLLTVSLPDSLTEISAETFAYCSNLTQVRLGKNLTKIGEGAFIDCKSLPSIDFPDSVSEIGRKAFYYCEGLFTMDIPDRVTVIEAYAFANCIRLKKITIGENVTKVVQTAFQNCTGLTEICYNAVDMQGYSTYSCVFDNCGIDGDGITLTIGNKVKQIPDGMFKARWYVDEEEYMDAKIVRVVFQEGSQCTSIGMAAFSNCLWLEEVELPDGLKTIGGNAFENCKALRSVVIPDSVEKVGGMAFDGCVNLERVEIGNGLKKISDYMFRFCYKLETVLLGDSVESIGHSAFAECSSLTFIRFPKNVSEMGVSAFENCNQLTVVRIESPKLAALVEEELANRYYAILPPKAHTVMVDASIDTDCPYLRQYFLYTYTQKANGKAYVVYSNLPFEGKHTHIFDETWRADEDSHWKLCQQCEEQRDESAHVYDDVCDSECNICAYQRKVNHSYDYECDIDCNLCGAVRDAHHYFSINNHDDQTHWVECAFCGEINMWSGHTWSNSVVIKEPTTEEDGVRRQSCGCGATRDRIILRLPAEQTTVADLPEAVPLQTDTPEDQQNAEHTIDENSALWILLGAFGVTIISGGMVVLLTTGKQRKKQ